MKRICDGMITLLCTAAALGLPARLYVRAQDASQSEGRAAGPALFGYLVVHVYPHDLLAYTQGLLYRGGFLYESTGLNGRSSLRRVELETGRVLQQYDLDAKYFGEGLTDWQDRLVQLTWEAGMGFVYDLESFRLVSRFSYTGEGWGLTHDRRRLILSDGTSSLRFLDPVTYREIGRLPVRDRGKPVADLNELEWVRDRIFANVWHSDRIAIIDPGSGVVGGWADLSGLLSLRERPNPEAVLNGIAYDPIGDRLFVTGKLWPKLFEIRLQPRTPGN